MTKIDTSPGEDRLKRRERLTLLLIAAGFVGGFGLGFGLSQGTEGPMFAADTVWPSGLALGAVAFFVTVVGALVILANRNADELEKGYQAKGFEAAMWFMLFAYPSWYTLWKGGFVPEPSHQALFIATFAASFVGYLYYRFR